MTTGLSDGIAPELAWLGLEIDGPAGAVVIDDRHVTHLGRLYGGMGSALICGFIEAVTQRSLLWATTQFVGAASKGDRLELRAEVLAAGRRTSQVRVDALVGGQLILHAVGAAGLHRPDVAEGTVPRRPDVPPAEACPPYPLGVPAAPVRNFFELVEARDAGTVGGQRQLWWMRLAGGPSLTRPALTRPALLSLAGDFVPSMVMAALGQPGAGTSLDNTLRIGEAVTGEWVLVDGQPEQASGGFGHGSVRLWSADGVLAGVASQTTALWHRL
jgi:acyl-CoA thioesterase